MASHLIGLSIFLYNRRLTIKRNVMIVQEAPVASFNQRCHSWMKPLHLSIVLHPIVNLLILKIKRCLGKLLLKWRIPIIIKPPKDSPLSQRTMKLWVLIRSAFLLRQEARKMQTKNWQTVMNFRYTKTPMKQEMLFYHNLTINFKPSNNQECQMTLSKKNLFSPQNLCAWWTSKSTLNKNLLHQHCSREIPGVLFRRGSILMLLWKDITAL